MLLTTSKHASKEMQATARRLAAHLPECRYIPRSERALERLQTLATRAGEETILVVGAPQTQRPSKGKKKISAKAAAPKKATPLPLAVLSSRSRSSDGWSWHAQSLAIQKLKFGSPLSLRREDDPLEVKVSAAAPSHALSSFLGLPAGKRSPLFADSTPLLLKAGAKKLEIKSGKTPLIQLDYAWC